MGTNKEKKCPLDTYQFSNQDPLEELLDQLKEGQFSYSLTSKQKLSLLRTLNNNRPAFAIGEEPLGKIRGNDIEIHLDVERSYPPILRRPPYHKFWNLGRKFKKINELLDMDFIGKIGNNEIVEVITTFLITLHYGKSRFCGDFRSLNNYTKADRYPML
ncbi:hypothetical protein O181_015217 [Austropuccinia psidii MF-1]|uniref:Uncharacterized protein n=1 Tax=Austropuccinia psidii MF-1 TaxID=1389203 RepID=A0A9Q3C383_9BASI|nr:hypothetical protein [Austropuccinia psidii MF-1]